MQDAFLEGLAAWESNEVADAFPIDEDYYETRRKRRMVRADVDMGHTENLLAMLADTMLEEVKAEPPPTPPITPAEEKNFNCFSVPAPMPINPNQISGNPKERLTKLLSSLPQNLQIHRHWKSSVEPAFFVFNSSKGEPQKTASGKPSSRESERRRRAKIREAINMLREQVPMPSNIDELCTDNENAPWDIVGFLICLVRYIHCLQKTVGFSNPEFCTTKGARNTMRVAAGLGRYKKPEKDPNKEVMINPVFLTQHELSEDDRPVYRTRSAKRRLDFEPRVKNEIKNEPVE